MYENLFDLALLNTLPLAFTLPGLAWPGFGREVGGIGGIILTTPYLLVAHPEDPHTAPIQVSVTGVRQLRQITGSLPIATYILRLFVIDLYTFTLVY